MADNDSRRDAGRRKAQDQFTKVTKGEDGFRLERERAHAASAGKMARLKVLRLAKEKAEQDEAALKGPSAPPPPRKRAAKKAPPK